MKLCTHTDLVESADDTCINQPRCTFAYCAFLLVYKISQTQVAYLLLLLALGRLGAGTARLGRLLELG